MIDFHGSTWGQESAVVYSIFIVLGLAKVFFVGFWLGRRSKKPAPQPLSYLGAVLTLIPPLIADRETFKRFPLN